jgi:hypothetical protein
MFAHLSRSCAKRRLESPATTPPQAGQLSAILQVSHHQVPVSFHSYFFHNTPSALKTLARMLIFFSACFLLHWSSISVGRKAPETENKKETNMKTINRKSLITSAVCALAISFGSAAYAEKGAETLVRLTKGSAPAKTEVAAPAAHKCANCTDSLVSVVDKGTKGPNHLVTKVARHNCSACDTKIVTRGAGKATQQVAIHSCGADTKAICCASN